MFDSYRKKPVVIQAAQWDGTAEGAIQIIDWILTGEHAARYHDKTDDVPNAKIEIAIDTLEGTITASPGDWIIQGVKGEFYPCKPDIFAATYEPVGDTTLLQLQADMSPKLGGFIAEAVRKATENPGKTFEVGE